MLFHSPRHKFASQIILKFEKKKISQETCVKFLGVLLVSDLSWKSHITELSKKLSRTVGLFCKTRDPTDPVLDTGFLNVPHAQGISRGRGHVTMWNTGIH